MSNIRPIGDASLATAMLATFQSIDGARSAPAGISAPRWRILQCAHAAGETGASFDALRLCSGLNPAALAEHIQALRWKGLMAMDSYRLSASAVLMVEDCVLAPARPVDGVVAMRHAIAALETVSVAPEPTIISFDLSNDPDLVAAQLLAFGTDGKIEPLDPADVPACLRPDCTAPVAIAADDKKTDETNKRGRGGAAVARPHQGAEHCDPVAADCISEVSQVRILPPANPPKSTNWIADRLQRIAGATAFLKSQGILVTVVDRDAPIREYFVSGKRYRQLAEEVIEIAIAKGWAE